MPICPLRFALPIRLETHWMLEKEPEHLSGGIPAPEDRCRSQWDCHLTRHGRLRV
jgi:hypothetical protein